MTRGRLEAQITIPTGGWSFTMSITGLPGTSTQTIAAGTYYPTDLITEWSVKLEQGESALGGGAGFGATGSFTETGTGLVTTSYSGGVNFAISTWDSTSLRDFLGYAGTLSGAQFYTGTKQCRGVWLPNAEIASYYGNADEGHTETDQGSTESPRGDVKVLSYNTRQVLPSVRWSNVLKAYARISAETTVGASFEQWWRWTQGGELTYFEAGAPVRLYWDAGSGTYKTYRIPTRKGTQMDRVDPAWDGLYTIELERLVRVPGT